MQSKLENEVKKLTLEKSFSRRSFFSNSSVTLAFLLTGSVTLLQACGQDTSNSSNSRKRTIKDEDNLDANSSSKSGSTKSKESGSTSSSDNGSAYDPSGDADVVDGDSDGLDEKDGTVNEVEPSEKDPENTDSQTETNQRVIGAKPNSSFFSRGAPQLTKEQIHGDQDIEATCEGSNHGLVITRDHLAQLAAGKSVSIDSSRNPHPGNPTNHLHVIVYEPILG